jgi:hypothetical protein
VRKGHKRFDTYRSLVDVLCGRVKVGAFCRFGGGQNSAEWIFFIGVAALAFSLHVPLSSVILFVEYGFMDRSSLSQLHVSLDLGVGK